MAPEEVEKTRLFPSEPMESIWLNNLSILTLHESQPPFKSMGMALLTSTITSHG